MKFMDDISNQKKLNLSLCMIVKNEEKNLKKFLPNIMDIVSELIVIDTGSTDNTIKISEEFGAKIYNSKWEGDFAKLRNEVVNYAQSEWILLIDADERITQGLKNEIIKVIIDNSKYSGYFIPRKNYYFGKWLKFGGNYPDYQLKLFRKGKVVFKHPPIHPKYLVEGEIGYLKSPIEHFPYENVEEYLKKFELYTTFDAMFLKEKNVKINFLNTIRWIIIKPFIRFIKRYFLKFGFLNGIPGLFACIFDALGYVIRYIKLWDIYRSEENK